MSDRYITILLREIERAEEKEQAEKAEELYEYLRREGWMR